ncbi:molybdopterin-dependent oxidoreductase [Sphingobacterium oryzagri]|uniref:Molybdopterin-dependent oxidoreductase n=1 Tax=Sphingobacterium oryzagri TaxID=3025669 RepID=A0ABY7WEM8_9SPHI|nr:molybdopterin-dependent oxidoreductase [Sphingobacterium sp. KACC 22765]WDF66823.1 molybdopterin-dependent oxidoreductase [Sphingobacterium sp. KACC 22765]
MVKLTYIRCVLLFIVTSLSSWSYAQQHEVLTVNGEVNKPLSLSLDDLRKMPLEEIQWTDRDQQQKINKGVSVSAILALAGAPTGSSLRGENIRKFLLVSCADGYEVVFSLAELDDSFSDKKAILAFEENGRELPLAKGPLRLVIPGEKKPARSCFQVTQLHIGTASID